MINHPHHLVRRLVSAILTFSAMSLPGLRAAPALEDLSVAEIAELLPLTKETVASLQSLFADYQAKQEDIERRISWANSPDSRKALVGEIEALARRFHSSLQAIVSEEQMEKLKSHLKDVKVRPDAKAGQGGADEILAELDLSPEQGIRMKALMAVYQPQIQTLVSQLKEAGNLRSKRNIAGSIDALREEMNKGVQSILSTEQFAKWQRFMESNKESMREELRGR